MLEDIKSCLETLVIFILGLAGVVGIIAMYVVTYALALALPIVVAFYILKALGIL